jgi:hypothetical protein
MHPDNSLSLEQSIAWHRAEIARLMANTIGRRPAARIGDFAARDAFWAARGFA